MPKDHAKLSASGSARWLACTPSADFERQFPEEPSIYAEEGTAAHEVAEKTARYYLGLLPEQDYENWLEDFKKTNDYYNQEMQEHAISYAKFVNAKHAAYLDKDPEIMFETRLDFSEYVPEGFGTGDCVIIADGTVEIIDFKYGKGVRVSAENNSQMRLYAIGALNLAEAIYDIDTVKATIYQPRLSGANSTETLTVEELRTWAETFVKPRAKLAIAGKGEFAPGEETCRFCKAKAYCRARAAQNLAVIANKEISTPLSDEEVSAVLASAGDIKSWLSDLEERVTKALFEGQKVAGWKLVEGRSNRKITDPEKAVDALINAGFADIYKPNELLSLTALEKLYGPKDVAAALDGLIEKAPGKPTLVQESDPRPAYIPAEQTIKDFDN